MVRKLIPAVLFSLAVALVVAQPVHEATRGELLYATHCVTCHDAEVHWRDRKRVSDWASLRAEVARWQEMSSLGWNGEEIDEVSRYLQAVYYRNVKPE
ncbi:hypothetical protein [Accumulibacter sp.]|uniref:hypothetical protein n=1 Tax=Accumulibacter sp. TaxID=2053492 RepID=UPI0025EBA67D|nr:hypothetical protein [Accumulibacter sp.]MCM8627673.1 hypothetical protein [Accumulibacter sp.]